MREDLTVMIVDGGARVFVECGNLHYRHDIGNRDVDRFLKDTSVISRLQ